MSDILSLLKDFNTNLTKNPSADQLSNLYDVYLTDFVTNPLFLDGRRVIVNNNIIVNNKVFTDDFLKGKQETFAHIVTRNKEKTKNRCFDVNRANKIHWIRPILENATDLKIIYFEEIDYKGKWCRFFWYKRKNYIVILREVSINLLLVTGFCVDSDEGKRYQKLWETYQRKEALSKKTYLEGRYATLGNAIGGIFSPRHILYSLSNDDAKL